MLPISESPVTGYSHQAFLFSILFPHPEALPWIYSHYIQLFILKDLFHNEGRSGAGDFFYSYFGDWQYLELRTCPWLQYQSIPCKLAFGERDVHAFVQLSIDSGHYVRLPVETAFLPAYGTPGVPYPHDLLIYGYDSRAQQYYAADNFKDGRYGFVPIPFGEIEAATSLLINTNIQSPVFLDTVTLLAFRQCYNPVPEMFALNLPKIANDIKEYLQWDGYGKIYRQSDSYAFGLSYYHELETYYTSSCAAGRQIDIRSLATFRDHKRLMGLRMEYLLKERYISDTGLLDTAGKLCGDTEKVWHLILLYNAGGQARHIKQAISLLATIRKTETALLLKVMFEIEQ